MLHLIIGCINYSSMYSSPPWAFLPSAAMGLNVLCEGGGTMNLIKINMPEPFLLL